MFCKNLFLGISLALFVCIGNTALAGCPSADLTGDCCVDYEDFADISAQWLNEYDSNDLAEMAKQWLTGYPNMAYIPGGEFEMGAHHEDIADANTHLVYVDSYLMNKFEITNQQYCDFLNSADVKVDPYSDRVYASSDSSNSYPYCGLYSLNPPSLLRYSGSVFSVKKKRDGGRNMSDDPVIMVSWYGSVAYCNWRSSEEGKESCYNLSTWECDFSKHGYRLPTEAEWEYAARGGKHSPYYRFPWGNTISHSQANYYANPDSIPYDVSPTSGYHPDWKSGIYYPYTSVVGSFPPNGYGLYDMAGNVHEWCNDWYDSDYYYTSPYDNPHGPPSGTGCVYRGGCWNHYTPRCRVAGRFTYSNSRGKWRESRGFRIVLDSNPMPPLEENLDIGLSLNKSWMYQNLPGATGSNLTANASIVHDPQSNSSYTYDWEIILPDNVTVAPVITAGGETTDPCCTFAAPSCNEPNGISDSGQALTVRVTVTGDQYGNSRQAEAQFGIALLGDVNNDTVVNIADRNIINAFWQDGSAGDFTLRDCDLNCDGSVNIADYNIANAVWRGQLGQNQVSNTCPFR